MDLSVALTNLGRAKWANATELAAIRKMLPGNEVVAARMVKNPTVMVTPRPYLEAGTGEYRKAFLLRMDSEVLEPLDWEHWAAGPESSWRSPVPNGLRAMAVVFGTPGVTAPAPPPVPTERTIAPAPLAPPVQIPPPVGIKRKAEADVEEPKPDSRPSSRKGTKEVPEADLKRARPEDEPEDSADAARVMEGFTNGIFLTTTEEKGSHFSVKKKKGGELTAKQLRELTANESRLFEEADAKEWAQLKARGVVRIHGPEAAAKIRAEMPHRIMGSRMVRRWKKAIDGSRKAKSRWCILGFQDPDLLDLIRSGSLSTPTVSSASVKMGFQLSASYRFRVNLIDIAQAFLQGKPLNRAEPIFVELPPGGLPGEPDGVLLELLTGVYGLSDAPSNWHSTLVPWLVESGWEVAETDPCMFILRDDHRESCLPPELKKALATAENENATMRHGKPMILGEPVGLILLHVDDLFIAGRTQKFRDRLESLKNRFEIGSFRAGTGEFLGSHVSQDPETFEISVSQSTYVEGLKPVKVSANASEDSAATPAQISAFRGILGELGWLAKQTRGDLSVQVSFGQQSLPEPKVKDLRRANNALRRAKQHSSLGLSYAAIAPADLAFVMHSDASLANIRKVATQGGYVIAATQRSLLANKTAVWQPVAWRSGRLKRVIVSTLASEAQAHLIGIRELEWVLSQAAEVMYGLKNFALREFVLTAIPSTSVTDAKSLYDSLVQPSSANVQDREAGLDVICIKQVMQRTGTVCRWAPGSLNVSDVMTKDAGAASDLYRSCDRQQRYTLGSEDAILKQRGRGAREPEGSGGTEEGEERVAPEAEGDDLEWHDDLRPRRLRGGAQERGALPEVGGGDPEGEVRSGTLGSRGLLLKTN